MKNKADSEQASLVINGENRAKHLEVTGFIKFRNTHGYLNGFQYPFLKYYTFMTLVYIGLLSTWLLLLKKHQDQLINLHYYVLAIIMISLFECVFNWIQYSFINRKGRFSTGINLICMLINIFRSTFARVVTLVVALGSRLIVIDETWIGESEESNYRRRLYSIHIKTIERYQNKILIVSFLYMASLAAYNGITYIKYSSPVS
jgi:hypothetical protein